jgi:prevent-host-death family protein
MRTVEVRAASRSLSRLLKQVAAGEEIVLTRKGKPVARLVPVHETLRLRVPGTYRGRIRIDDAFYEPLPGELLDAFEGKRP